MTEGKAVQVVRFDEDERSFVLDEEALKDILCQDEIGDKPVCILSVAGRHRRFPLILDHVSHAPFSGRRLPSGEVLSLGLLTPLPDFF